MTAFHFETGPLSPADSHRVIVPAGLQSKAELLAFLHRALALPDYFGHNWDALEECLTDPDWLKGKTLVLAHQDIPLENRPDGQKTYLLVLASIAEETAGNLSVHFPEETRSRIVRLLGE